MSGSTIGGVVGGVIGFMFGNPQLGWMIGSAIGGYVDPDQIEGPRLKDAQVQTSQEGVPRPIIYGTAAVAGNLIHRGPLVETRKKERAGKGGPEQITYHYHMTYAIRVCEGPIAGIRRIWRDDKLVYSLREGDTIDADSAAFASNLTIYLGTESQLPDPSLEALSAEYNGGAGNVPSHRGTAYVVFENDNLTERRGTIPQYRFEVVSEGTSTEGHNGVTWLATNGGGKFLKSIGGTDWTTLPTYTTGATGGSLLYGGGVVVASDAVDTRYSLDEGETWTISTFDSGPGQADGFHGAYIGSRFWVAQDGAGGADKASYAWSAAGATFTQRDPSTPGASISIAGRVGLIVGGRNSGYVSVSTDNGQTWSSVDLASTYTQCVGCNGSRVVIASGPGNPSFRYTDDGTTFSAWVVGPTLGNTFALAANGSTWVSAHSAGLAYSTNNGVSWAAATLPGTMHASDVKFSGGMFVAVGRRSSGTGIAVVMTSPDGITWTERSNNFGFEMITSVVPITCEGVEIPDAPGYYATYDGELCGAVFGTITPSAVTLGGIVTDLCKRVGVTAVQMDVSELTDVVTGFAVSRQMPASEAIRSLQRAYRFDFPEWDKKLRGIKRGAAIKATITDDDIVSDPEETRAQSVEFPRKLNLITADPDANYESVTDTSARSTDHVKAVGETTMELPVIFSGPDERAQVSDILHKIAWTEAQGRLDIELPEEWTWLTPSDCFAYNDKRWRAEKTELLDGTLKVEAKRDRASAYTSGVSGDARSPTSPASSIKGPTIGAVLNLPRLRTAHDKPGVYLAATGLLPGWGGCDWYLSVDGGLTEQPIATALTRATMGELVSAVGTSGEPITVRLYDGRELDSITTAQLAAGFNGFSLTTDGTSEVAQFQTATLATYWELTNVQRGKLNTTAAAHAAGDPFLLLDEAVIFVSLDSSLIGQELIFRAVTRGTAPENNATITVTFDPQFTGAEVIEFLLTEANARILAEDGSYILED